LLLVASLNDNIGSAKTRAVSACTEVEGIGSAMASMPHYLSVGVNDIAATGIEKSVSAMVQVLDMMLSGVEAIIFFFINFVVGTYVCLITALIHGSLDVVASVTEDATEAFNRIIRSATSKIEDISDGLEGSINDIAEGIEDSIIGSFIPDIPKVDFSAPIKELQGFDLNADDFVKDVRQLNDDLPNFDEVQNMTKEAIAIPFDLVRGLLNDSYGAYTFDRDVFPLAQREQLTFCSDNNMINDFFDGLFSLVERARVIFIVVLVILAVAVMVPMGWMEVRRWRQQQRHAKLIAMGQHDPMDIVYIASRPVTSSWGIWIASSFGGKREILVRWCIAYATSPPALFVLSLAMAGFFSCLCQFILLRAVQDQVPNLVDQVAEFSDNVVESLQAVSDGWANGANGVITGLNDDINNDVLGYVTNATNAVNDTLTVFLDTMNEGLETVFNGTILLDPIRTVLGCVIFNKIESVQDGLTWVHDHAQVTLPLFSKDTFSMGAEESISDDSDLNTFLSSPSSVTSDEVTGAVDRVVTWLHNNIIQEALISLGIFLVYLIVVLLGVVRTLAGMAMPDKGRAEGAAMHFTGDGRPPLSPRQVQNDGDDFARDNNPAPPVYAMSGAGGGEKSSAGYYSHHGDQGTHADPNNPYDGLGISKRG